jgi:hypothetical protein
MKTKSTPQEETQTVSTFESILTSTTRLDDIKDIPPIPQGTYLVQINGPHEMIKSTQKQTDGAQINLRLLQARDDVDPDALRAHLDAANRSLMDVQLRYTFWDSPYLEQSLRDFFRNAMGFDGDWSVSQCFANIPGKQVLAHVRHRPVRSNDGTMRISAEVDSFASAE